MAYLDLAFDLPRAAIAAPAPRHDAVPHIAPLERQVVQLSRLDGRATLRAPGRIDALIGLLFGGQRTNGLADPRLEALRRYAVMFRLQGEALPQAETDRLLGAGFLREAIEEIRELVRNPRPFAA
ncbi:hypothetical protein [Sphingomonas pituitosa]|uniref:hypothetical protein n=1 Tax=Sphingomonas pituitosa TaxID=99597 RepID=UPI00082DC96D|nr:hypothetical protein [Sphingomonas pituitosa]